MCRMLVATGSFDPSLLVEGFLRMASDRGISHDWNEHRKGQFLHKEGWGAAWLEDGRLELFHSLVPAYDDPQIERFRDLDTPLLVLHARKATHGTHALENLHPFRAEHPSLGEVAFCHNGLVDDRWVLPESVTLKGDTDTEHYMHALLAAIRQGTEATDMETFIRDLKEFSGANCILASTDRAMVLARWAENDRYYCMWRRTTDDVDVISSEPLAELGDGWDPVPAERALTLTISS